MIEHIEALAVKSVALKDPLYFYRRVCRYYSEKFHTPLLEVYDIAWPFVLQNYLEHIIENNHDRKEMYNLAIDICYPELRENEEEELQRRIREIEAEEAAKREMAKRKREEDKKEVKNSYIDDHEGINMDKNMFSHLDEEMEEDD